MIILNQLIQWPGLHLKLIRAKQARDLLAIYIFWSSVAAAARAMAMALQPVNNTFPVSACSFICAPLLQVRFKWSTLGERMGSLENIHLLINNSYNRWSPWCEKKKNHCKLSSNGNYWIRTCGLCISSRERRNSSHSHSPPGHPHKQPCQPTTRATAKA